MPRTTIEDWPLGSDPTHPGGPLAWTLDEPEISGSRLARAIGVPGLDMTPQYWLNLQRIDDLDPAGEDADVRTMELLERTASPGDRNYDGDRTGPEGDSAFLAGGQGPNVECLRWSWTLQP